ncbi:hypothetical protein FF098_012335 [Parvularcula flava]|uniref:Uncharacterized protein n=1 Tax=Aquisalinus luteolus TaxID=1566827 RepID=A0A8J3A308_9PROT|nr:hypothetical protein [Aquisalinus luteolus]NHK28699.1 hypothetical protein [Aquisalinus luteolus]GGH99252.1 hypothetical protein GCM10011355_24770 [Aquisalinus luteolus]
MGRKKFILAALAIIVVAAWLAMGAAIIIKPEKAVFITIVTATAVLTEVAIWITAGVLGVAVFQARRRIWQFVTSPFARS